MVVRTAATVPRSLRISLCTTSAYNPQPGLCAGGRHAPQLRAHRLDWTVLNFEFRRRAHQPGYGRYAVALRSAQISSASSVWCSR